MKFIREKFEIYFRKIIYSIFLNEKYSSVLPKVTLDKFISFGVSFTNFFLNLAIFFSMYYVFVVVAFSRIGFEKTVVILLIVIISLVRIFLEKEK